jgi:TM2 domain-containing membrane protein YozV
MKMQYLTKLLFPTILTVFIALSILSFNFNGYTEEYNVTYDYENQSVLEKNKQQPSPSRSGRDNNRAQKRRRIIRRPQYYPIKSPSTAASLSALIPGMGQVYAGSPGKGALFLMSEIALFYATAFNFDRADYYDYYADRYDRFYDEYSDSLITYKQGYVEAKKYKTLGAMFLLGTLGAHVWNIFDAADTARAYNRNHALRLGFKFQPKDGTYITLNKQF